MEEVVLLVEATDKCRQVRVVRLQVRSAAVQCDVSGAAAWAAWLSRLIAWRPTVAHRIAARRPPSDAEA